MLRFRFQFLLLFLHYSSDEPSQFSHTIPPLFSSVGGEGFVPFQWGAKSRTANSTCVTTSVTRASLVTSSWSSSSAPTASSATPTTPTTKTTPSSARRFTSPPPFSASAVASSPRARYVTLIYQQLLLLVVFPISCRFPLLRCCC